MGDKLVIGFDHVSVLVSDLHQAKGFYVDLLGLTTLPRPTLGFDGLWLSLGQGQTLHLMQLPNPDPIAGRPEHAGKDRHIALRVSSLGKVEQLLQDAGMAYTRSQSGRSSLFCRDPDGNGVEFMAWVAADCQ